MSNWSNNMALIWPIIYNSALVILTILMLANIKGKNTRPAFITSILSLAISFILTATTLAINLYSNNKPAGDFLPVRDIIAVYSLPTLFLIFGLFSTIYQDRHHNKIFQNFRFIALIIETLIIYGSVFYIIYK